MFIYPYGAPRPASGHIIAYSCQTRFGNGCT